MSELLSPPFGAYLMDKYGALFTYYLTIPTRILAILIMAFIPQTGPKLTTETSSLDESMHGDTDLDAIDKPTFSDMIRRNFNALHAHISNNMIPILSRGVIILGILSLLVNTFARPLFDLLIQYMRVRFSWEYSQVCTLAISQSFGLILSVDRIYNIFPSCVADHLPNHCLTCRSRLAVKEMWCGTGKSLNG